LTLGGGEFVHQRTMFFHRERTGSFSSFDFICGLHTLRKVKCFVRKNKLEICGWPDTNFTNCREGTRKPGAEIPFSRHRRGAAVAGQAREESLIGGTLRDSTTIPVSPSPPGFARGIGDESPASRARRPCARNACGVLDEIYHVCLGLTSPLNRRSSSPVSPNSCAHCLR
jgi:hypothetical protein